MRNYAARSIFYSFHYKWLSDCSVLGKRVVYFGNTKIILSRVLHYSPGLCAVLYFLLQWGNHLALNSAGLDFCHPLQWIAEPASELLFISFLPPRESRWVLPHSPAGQRGGELVLHFHRVSNTRNIIGNALPWKGIFGNCPGPCYVSQMLTLTFHKVTHLSHILTFWLYR